MINVTEDKGDNAETPVNLKTLNVKHFMVNSEITFLKNLGQRRVVYTRIYTLEVAKFNLQWKPPVFILNRGSGHNCH